MHTRRTTISGLILALVALAGSCVATPVPQPPGFELDIEKLSAEPSDAALVVTGEPGAITPGGTTLRFTPGPTDSDPILEQGTVESESDGSFDVLVVSPLPNTFFVEAVTDDGLVFLAAIVIAEDGTVTEGDPGPDGDGDGSPDEIDCTPDDPAEQGCP